MRAPDRQAAQAGFSLLELLIVLAIIASLAGLSVAWLEGGNGQGLAANSEQLRRDLERAALVALDEQRVVGLRPDHQGYVFVTRGRDDTTWRSLDMRRLPPRHWPDTLQLERLPSPPADDDAPWLLWWPDGEVAGGRLRLGDGQAARTLVVDALGVRFATEGDDA